MMQKRLFSIFFFALPLSFMFGLAGCVASVNSGGTGGSGTTPPSTSNEWTWMSGSNAVNAVGVFGTQGTASTSNAPGARSGSVGWTDSSGNLWLFGGWGFATNSAVGSTGNLNDLWEFNPSTKQWNWVGGSNTASHYGANVTLGIYGSKGVPSTSNVPGPRNSAVSWTDSGGNFWLFGGSGFTSSTTSGNFNDLWEFTPSTKQWTWVSGSNTTGAGGVYGTQGVASTSNTPGARGASSEGPALGWVDTSGNLWLFGGVGFSDIWEFNTATKAWTWIAGSTTIGAVPVYGVQGVASATNTPGGRELAVSWADKSGNLWLYGGEVSSVGFDLSDLWQIESVKFCRSV